MTTNLYVLQLRKNKLISVLFKKLYYLLKVNDEFITHTKLKGIYYNNKYPTLLFLDLPSLEPFFEIIPVYYFNKLRNQTTLSVDALINSLTAVNSVVKEEVEIKVGDKVELSSTSRNKFAIVKEINTKQKVAKVSLISNINFPFLIEIPMSKLKLVNES